MDNKIQRLEELKLKQTIQQEELDNLNKEINDIEQELSEQKIAKLNLQVNDIYMFEDLGGEIIGEDQLLIVRIEKLTKDNVEYKEYSYTRSFGEIYFHCDSDIAPLNSFKQCLVENQFIKTKPEHVKDLLIQVLIGTDSSVISFIQKDWNIK